MSTTLTLIEAAWAAARTAAERGRTADALAQTERLLARPDLSPADAPGAHLFAGELALDLGRYATARRALRAAAKLAPGCARTRFLLGRAWEEDPDGCDRRAAVAYRAASKRDAAHALYRAAFGRAAARCGRAARGARELVRAAGAALTDLAVVRLAVTGLLEVGRTAQARSVLSRARFACPGGAPAAELGALWERVKFESARRAQRKAARTGAARETTRYAQDARFATDGDRVTLPFLRVFDGAPRRDPVSVPRPHLGRLPRKKADW